LERQGKFFGFGNTENNSVMEQFCAAAMTALIAKKYRRIAVLAFHRISKESLRSRHARKSLPLNQV
jgi:hypothetical protein